MALSILLSERGSNPQHGNQVARTYSCPHCARLAVLAHQADLLCLFSAWYMIHDVTGGHVELCEASGVVLMGILIHNAFLGQSLEYSVSNYCLERASQSGPNQNQG